MREADICYRDYTRIHADGEAIEGFKEIARHGGLALIHAENDSILHDNLTKLKAEGGKFFSARVEVEAGRCMFDYLEMTGCKGMIVTLRYLRL